MGGPPRRFAAGLLPPAAIRCWRAVSRRRPARQLVGFLRPCSLRSDAGTCGALCQSVPSGNRGRRAVSITLGEKQEQELARRPWLDVVGGWPLGFLAALQFLTVVPPLIRRPLTPVELGRAVGWFPLVGVLLGVALIGTDSA